MRHFSEKEKNYHLYQARMNAIREENARQLEWENAKQAQRKAEESLRAERQARKIAEAEKAQEVAAREKAEAEKVQEAAARERAEADKQRLREKLIALGLDPDNI